MEMMGFGDTVNLIICIKSLTHKNLNDTVCINQVTVKSLLILCSVI